MKKKKLSKVEKILVHYKELCSSHKEDRFGYRQALKDARKKAAEFHKINTAKKFIKELDCVINDHKLHNCFPYSQAFFHLKDMVMDRIEELVKEQA